MDDLNWILEKLEKVANINEKLEEKPQILLEEKSELCMKLQTTNKIVNVNSI